MEAEVFSLDCQRITIIKVKHNAVETIELFFIV